MEKTITKQDDRHIVELSGRFTFVDHGTFKECVDTLLSEDCKKCTLDISKLEFIDSAGLGMLLILKDEIAKNDGELVVTNPQGQVDKMLQVSHFDRMLTIQK